jgi:hypothetical protein
VAGKDVSGNTTRVGTGGFSLFDQLGKAISANAQMHRKSSEQWPDFYHLIDF